MKSNPETPLESGRISAERQGLGTTNEQPPKIKTKVEESKRPCLFSSILHLHRPTRSLIYQINNQSVIVRPPKTFGKRVNRDHRAGDILKAMVQTVILILSQ